MAATFRKKPRGDVHYVSLRVAGLTAAEIVRDVVDVIARNTERADRHKCLRIDFALPPCFVQPPPWRQAAERLRALYTGPYGRVLITYD